MERHIKVEVIFLTHHSPTSRNRKEVVKWLTTALQPALHGQYKHKNKMLIKILKDIPAIYLS